MLLNDPDFNDIRWMRTNIVDFYGFEKDPKKDAWINQPDFAGHFGNDDFKDKANRVKIFFGRNNDWETTKNNPKFRTEESCINLLYITAARHLLVAHMLFEQSGSTLTPCTENEEGKTLIPASGVCLVKPYGTTSCTSDYDVGLVGKKSWRTNRKL